MCVAGVLSTSKSGNINILSESVFIWRKTRNSVNSNLANYYLVNEKGVKERKLEDQKFFGGKSQGWLKQPLVRWTGGECVKLFEVRERATSTCYGWYDVRTLPPLALPNPRILDYSDNIRPKSHWRENNLRSCLSR